LTKPDRTVAVQKVKLGPSDGQRVAVLSGLQAGDNVVVDGADRLRDGAKITVASAAEHPDGASIQATPDQAGQQAAAPMKQRSSQPRDQQQGQGQDQGQGRGQRRSAP